MQSPDLNIKDLGLFAALKSRVWTEPFGTIDHAAEGVQISFREHASETFERLWQSLFERNKQVAIAGLAGAISRWNT